MKLPTRLAITRQQLQAALLLFVVIAVCGSLLRYQEEWTHSQVVSGTMGRPMSYGRQTITLERFATGDTALQVAGNGSVETIGRTDGVFFVVTTKISTEGRTEPSFKAWIDVDGVEYQATNSDLYTPPTGFEQTFSSLFELPRADLSGATVHYRYRAFIYVYERELSIDLGIDKQKSDEILTTAPQSVVRVYRTEEHPR